MIAVMISTTNKAINNISPSSMDKKGNSYTYDSFHFNNLLPSINPDWIEANRICNLTRFDNIQDEAETSSHREIPNQENTLEMQEENLEMMNEGNVVHKLNNLKHTGNIPNQRVDNQIKGLPGIKPGQRIKLSELFTVESDGIDPKDLESMDTMDDLFL